MFLPCLEVCHHAITGPERLYQCVIHAQQKLISHNMQENQVNYFPRGNDCRLHLVIS